MQANEVAGGLYIKAGDSYKLEVSRETRALGLGIMALCAAAVRQACLGASTPPRKSLGLHKHGATITGRSYSAAWFSKGGRQWARSPLQEAFLVQRGPGSDLALLGPVERVYPLLLVRTDRGGCVLFFSSKNDNDGPGNAGVQVLPHGVTRRRIRH